MALSDYLTDDEWDACWYLSLGEHVSENFGESMRKTIDALLASGYNFSGLDSLGGKVRQVPSGNAKKFCIFLGNPYNVDVLAILDNGRNFLKIHLPTLVDETDEEWAKQMAMARLPNYEQHAKDLDDWGK